MREPPTESEINARVGHKFIRCSLAIENDFNKILGVVNGIAKVERLNQELSGHMEFERLIEWSFSKDRGSLSYTTIYVHEDVDNKKFQKLNGVISQMIRSYFNGFTLKPFDYTWIDETEGELF